MPNPLATFVGWTLVPGLATSFLQSVYYGIMIRAGDPKPQPGSPVWTKHNTRIKVALIIVYLLYTFYEACEAVSKEGNYYGDLGLPLASDDRAIRSRFRKLSAIYHPDKLGAEAGPESNTYFIHLKLAQDTLLDPARRFAYDRFGPDVNTWQRCVTYRDYLTQGLWTSAPQYVGSGLMLIVLGVTGYLQWGRFWRYFLIVCLMVLEMYVTTRPYFPPFLDNFLNPVLTRVTLFSPLLPFQFLVLARNMVFTFMIALSQLGPYLQSRAPSEPTNEIEPMKLAMLEQLARTSEMEASRLLELDTMPLKGDASGLQELRDQIKQWLVQSTIRANPDIQKAISEALRNRQTETVADTIPEES